MCLFALSSDPYPWPSDPRFNNACERLIFVTNRNSASFWSVCIKGLIQNCLWLAMGKTLNRSVDHLNYEQIICTVAIFASKQFGKVPDQMKTLLSGGKLYYSTCLLFGTTSQDLQFPRYASFPLLKWDVYTILCSNTKVVRTSCGIYKRIERLGFLSRTKSAIKWWWL